ncbi:hypothetical protein RBG61_09700 [Paludicola sp. MB14-C6]|uniref:LptM family lipoprotein n=1 Tax=Paludihabitans sp. MB14-C6 TaxID=3070656 RepID=UPI0027DB31EA|nr:hypothetical protein [Paludicola sp. MB14-C6]WMJ22261.1 hypothetical protein RBG61_09700 [Paludicola sp. MB14-C6]
MKYIGVMKRVSISFILIAVLFSLTACQKQKYIPPNAQKYQYNYYPGTDWGMTEQEVIKSLGIKQKEINRESEDLENSVNYSAFEIKKKVYGYPAMIRFSFHNLVTESNKPIGLTSVSIVFKDKYDMKQINAFLKADLTSQGDFLCQSSIEEAQHDDFSAHYEAKFTLSKLRESSGYENFKIKEYGKDLIVIKQGGPISTVDLGKDIEDENGTKPNGCYITYEGLMAAILNNIE